MINGADIKAGSKLSKRNKNGSAEPETDAKMEMATRLTPTAIATDKLPCNQKAHKVATDPNIAPSIAIPTCTS